MEINNRTLQTKAAEWIDTDEPVSAYVAGYRQAIEDAAQEAEKWWEMFSFESFQQDDTRRYANPNHIAACIRELANK